jgi:hypothetical protein
VTPTRPLALAALLSAALGCDTGFEPQYLVKDLRVLAVRAEVVGSTAADAAPGDSVQLEVLVANPLGRAPVSVRWFTCAPTGTDVLPPCLDQDLLRNPDALAATEGVFPLGEGERPPPIPVAEVREVAAALDAVTRRATEEPTYQCRLYAEVPVVVVVEAEGLRETAVKRVRLTPPPDELAGTPLEGAYVPNLNPLLKDVVRAPSGAEDCAAGVPVGPDHPAGRAVLCGRADAPGEYNVCGPAGERTLVRETRAWQWYVTGGSFPDEEGVGNVTDGAPEFERPAEAFTLWLILRDGRGGEGWLRRDVPAL